MSSQLEDDFRREQERASGMPKVKGFCPMGCGMTLFLNHDGQVICSKLTCPRPTAVDELLFDAETEHVIDLEEDHFQLQHPLRERLEGALFDCELHVEIAGLDAPPAPPGKYRVIEPAIPHEPLRYMPLDG